MKANHIIQHWFIGLAKYNTTKSRGLTLEYEIISFARIFMDDKTRKTVFSYEGIVLNI